MAAAKRFYGDLVGWTAQDMPTSAGGEPYSIQSADGHGVAGMMNLGEPMKAEGMPPNWTGYICMDDCDAAAAKAESLTGSVKRQPLDIPGVARFAILADPAGAIFAIMKPVPPGGGRPEVPPGTLGHVSWHELYGGRPRPASTSTPGCSAGRKATPWIWARWGPTSSVTGPMEVPGGDWVFQGMDPQGALFSVQGRKAG